MRSLVCVAAQRYKVCPDEDIDEWEMVDQLYLPPTKSFDDRRNDSVYYPLVQYPSEPKIEHLDDDGSGDGDDEEDDGDAAAEN
ncbi:hypothetical protein QR98_0037480 [Sarcoptes scabiei]|uniref:Uncharacterized protein n=1 Tax=Sarcoptes scabiei TaxID=52283 RepID=A0A132A2Q8_SARSC|nr:hypothetical protein QR98_0037480 [Sarcoptes scabiei]